MTYDAGHPCCAEYGQMKKEIKDLKRDLEIVRRAAHLFEAASHDWMDRALTAEASLARPR